MLVHAMPTHDLATLPARSRGPAPSRRGAGCHRRRAGCHSGGVTSRGPPTAPGAPTTAPPWRIRSARPDALPAIHELVRELAAYEREPDAVRATAGDLRR